MNSKGTGSKDFDAFVKRQQPTAAEMKPIDWAKQRDQWLEHLNNLYNQIESFLSQYRESGEIKCEYSEIMLNEEKIGAYKARQMNLSIGRQQITLIPIGTLLIGSKGRVDVVGSSGKTRFVLVDSDASAPTIKIVPFVNNEPPVPETPPKEIKWAWKIATSPPNIRYIELTRESLFQVLMEVSNG